MMRMAGMHALSINIMILEATDEVKMCRTRHDLWPPVATPHLGLAL
jgi:hypothetical protein